MPTRTRTQRPPIDLAVELEQAVERNEFGLEYQPIIDLGSGSIAAVEALLRWRHPLMGTIAPGDYLPLAEETGHIVPIGERVLDAATRQLRTWHLGFARMQSLRVRGWSIGSLASSRTSNCTRGSSRVAVSSSWFSRPERSRDVLLVVLLTGWPMTDDCHTVLGH